jgi:hypothetical protein
MARDGKGLKELILDTGAALVSRAAERIMSDPRGQEAVARAVGLAQRGRRKVEEAQERVMRAAGIPGRQDVQDLAKQLARLKRKARELAEKLDGEARGDRPAAGPPGNGHDPG